MKMTSDFTSLKILKIILQFPGMFSGIINNAKILSLVKINQIQTTTKIRHLYYIFMVKVDNFHSLSIYRILSK